MYGASYASVVHGGYKESRQQTHTTRKKVTLSIRDFNVPDDSSRVVIGKLKDVAIIP